MLFYVNLLLKIKMYYNNKSKMIVIIVKHQNLKM